MPKPLPAKLKRPLEQIEIHLLGCVFVIGTLPYRLGTHHVADLVENVLDRLPGKRSSSTSDGSSTETTSAPREFERKKARGRADI